MFRIAVVGVASIGIGAPNGYYFDFCFVFFYARNVVYFYLGSKFIVLSHSDLE